MNNFLLNKIYISKLNHNQRLDNFIISKFKFLSKSKIYCLIRTGKIKINQTKQKQYYKLQINDVVELPYFQNNTNNIQCYNDKIIKSIQKNILFEDKYLLILNKISGLAVHGGSNIKYSLIEQLKLNKNYYYIELLHRIDKNTSGILLLAKHPKMLKLMQELFKNRKIYKEYLGLVHGKWPYSQNILKNSLSNYYYFLNDNNLRDFYNNKQFDDIITKILVLNYFKQFSLLKIIPLTGKKHQIRIHTAMHGYPIVLDNRYGNFLLDKIIRKHHLLNRMFLHFYKIKFMHPINKQIIKIIAPLDKKLLICLKNII